MYKKSFRFSGRIFCFMAAGSAPGRCGAGAPRRAAAPGGYEVGTTQVDAKWRRPRADASKEKDQRMRMEVPFRKSFFPESLSVY
jgi:hypothetical protein